MPRSVTEETLPRPVLVCLSVRFAVEAADSLGFRDELFPSSSSWGFETFLFVAIHTPIIDEAATLSAAYGNCRVPLNLCIRVVRRFLFPLIVFRASCIRLVNKLWFWYYCAVIKLFPCMELPMVLSSFVVIAVKLVVSHVRSCDEIW